MMKLNRRIFSAALIGATLALGACTKGPMDTPLLMGKGVEAYKLDLSARAEKMTQEELDAFNWAVDGVTYQQLIEQAPNKTPREVIRLQVASSKAWVAKEMAPAEKAVADFEAIRAELQKITTSDVKFRLEKNFFGHMPHLSFSVANASRYDIGRIGYVASIMVNGSDKAEARKALSMDYKNAKPLAMESGSTYTEQHKVGFVSGDHNWTTQTILQAKSVEVSVVPDVATIFDLEGKRILPDSPVPFLERLKAAEKAVELYGAI